MRTRVAIFAVASLFAAFMSKPAPALGQQSSPQHEEHHPATTQAAPSTAAEAPANMMNMMARMKAMDTKLDELVRKMNAAKGPAKTDAMAELLTAIVEDRRMHEAMMSNMMSMMGNMNMMGGRGGRTETAPTPPKK